MFLEVRNLSKRFGGIRAVDQVDWSIGPGETRCIIGPNGAGKSTFFQLLIGRIRPDSGEIRFAGERITSRHPFERARLGIAVKPQTLGVFPDLTVEHNLRLCLQRSHHGAELEDRLADNLRSLQLVPKRLYPTRALSHGEKQWLGLGMALSSSPRLLLLDERSVAGCRNHGFSCWTCLYERKHIGDRAERRGATAVPRSTRSRTAAQIGKRDHEDDQD
jgi:ABC-type multidrug transport system ATPase subunit